MLSVQPKPPEPICPHCGYHGPMGIFRLPSLVMHQNGARRTWSVLFAPFETIARELARPMSDEEIAAEYARLEKDAADAHRRKARA